MDPVLFRTAAELGRWPAEHHATARELWVGFVRTGSGLEGLGYPEAVDEAAARERLPQLRP